MNQKFTKKQHFFKIILVSMLSALFLGACSSKPPQNISNICDIFTEKRDWFETATDMKERWGVPIHVPMAMMYQESSFKAKARPKRDYFFFGLIPWGHVSSAYGYSQAKTPTWDDYKRETNNAWAERSDFDDAMDFMGWFISKTNGLNGISKWDAELQYLNYHEGWSGYKKGNHNEKAWLLEVAKTVNARSLRYAAQLKSCEEELSKGWFRRLFS